MFHFKKFSIDDSKAAMKIGTDAVLLGAWTPCGNESRILDIGTGTGILALMMAQRNKNIPIDAVELESEAAALAAENVKLSPWFRQIQVFNVPIQTFRLQTSHTYSLIICNPPFFTNSLKAPDKNRNMARHNDTLPVEELLRITSKLLTEKGIASFIVPADAYEIWKAIAAIFSLFPFQVTWIKSSKTHNPNRALVSFTQEANAICDENVLSIYISPSVYTKEYQNLTKEFYLKF